MIAYGVNIDQYNQYKMPKEKLLSALQACDALNISAQTLYAYVSRGLLRTTRHPNDSRKKLYFSSDVDKLLIRQTRGRSRNEIARSTVDFGEPVLQSKISCIRDGEFFYRQINAVTLSQQASLEDVFELLCEASIKHKVRAKKDIMVSAYDQPLSRFVEALSHYLSSNNGAFGNRRSAYQLLNLMVSNAIAQDKNNLDLAIHERLAKAWSTDSRAADLIRRALVLSADHELNASTYAVRVTASAGASLSACMLTGVSTLSGINHGGLTDLCLQWMRQSTAHNISNVDLSDDKPPPGFGHRLYPNGDPRATEILKHCAPPKAWQRVVKQVANRFTLAQPTLDYGLATLEHQLKLPQGAGFSIFAIARTVGWLAHCFEQRKNGSLIRPRAY